MTSTMAPKDGEKKYRKLFTCMHLGYAYCKIEVDDKGNPVDFTYIEVNDAFSKLTGLKKKAVVGKKVTEVIPDIKQANPEIIDTYGEVALTGKPTSFEVFFKPLQSWFAIQVYSPGKGYFVALFDNITERKHLEETLNEYRQRLGQVVAQRTADIANASEKVDHEAFLRKEAEANLQLLSAIADKISHALLVIGPAGRLIYANEAAIRLYGYDRAELLNLSLRDLVQARDEVDLEAIMAAEGEMEAVHLKRGMVPVPVRLYSSPISLRTGKHVVIDVSVHSPQAASRGGSEYEPILA